MVSKKYRVRKSSFNDLAIIVLEKSRKPMTCGEIIRWARRLDLLKSEGQTPEKTLHASLSRSIDRDPLTPFRKNDRGRFDIRGRTYDAS